MIFYGIFMPILVGSIAFFVYRGMLSSSPDTAQTIYLLLAAYIAIVFTILAAAVFKMRVFVEFTPFYLARALEAANITGKYFESSTHPKDLRGEVIDYAKEERTWELGTSLVRDAPTAIGSNGEFAVQAIALEPF